MALRGLMGRVGGKSKLKDKIRRMMPQHSTYIEPFVGGGSVFFSAPADPNIKEVINDKDKDVAQMYIDVKNVGDKVVALPVIETKEQFQALKNKKSFGSPLERLKRNILLSNYSFRSDRTSFAPSRAIGKKEQKHHKRYDKYKERLKNTRILNQDYKSVIKKYDNPNAFIYLDPPYSMASTNKDYQNNDVPIEELINLLKSVKGKFILSYDNNATAKKLARDAGFKVMMVTTSYNDGKTGGSTIKKRELLIRNY
tara:strand:- start:1098 stop:1859 length:762 start_codon:yes stop_codon:yes gene_type:complete